MHECLRTYMKSNVHYLLECARRPLRDDVDAIIIRVESPSLSPEQISRRVDAATAECLGSGSKYSKLELRQQARGALSKLLFQFDDPTQVGELHAVVCLHRQLFEEL